MNGKNGKLKKNQELLAVGKNHVFSVKRLGGRKEGSGVFEIVIKSNSLYYDRFKSFRIGIENGSFHVFNIWADCLYSGTLADGKITSYRNVHEKAYCRAVDGVNIGEFVAFVAGIGY